MLEPEVTKGLAAAVAITLALVVFLVGLEVLYRRMAAALEARTGGEPRVLYDTLDEGLWGIVRSVLPGGRAALVSFVRKSSSSFDYAEIRVVSLDDRQSKTLPVTGFDARYLPSGHLVFGRGGGMLAAPFDVERLELRGEPVPVLESVAVESIFGITHVAFADNGMVALVPGGNLARGRLAWVDRQGSEGLLDMPDRFYGTFDLAPDDRRFALQVHDVQDSVWIWDARDGGRELTRPGAAGWPVWSPDGRELALREAMAEDQDLKVVVHDLQGGASRELLSSKTEFTLDSWAQPGLIGLSGYRPARVGVLKDTEPGEPQWVEQEAEGGSLGVWGAALSPDGGWIAYNSDEGGGRYQIWLEEIDGDVRQQVSTDGGVEPVWCRSCNELFYRQGNRILASRIAPEPEVEVGPPRLAFEAPDFVDTFRDGAAGPFARRRLVRKSS